MKNAISALALIATCCAAARADAQTMGAGMGPGYGQQFSIPGGDGKLEAQRCYDHHRSPEERAKSCKVLAEQGTVAADQMTLAEAYRLAGDYDDALAALAPVLSADPKSGQALQSRSEVYAAQGRYELALADADAILQARPDDDDGYNIRCWIRAIAGEELDAALADCDRVLAISPNDATTLGSRGFVNFKRGDLKAAIADYDKALGRTNDQASSLYMRGIAKRLSGDSEGAAEDIRTAKRHDPYIDDEFATYGVKP